MPAAGLRFRLTAPLTSSSRHLDPAAMHRVRSFAILLTDGLTAPRHYWCTMVDIYI